MSKTRNRPKTKYRYEGPTRVEPRGSGTDVRSWAQRGTLMPEVVVFGNEEHSLMVERLAGLTPMSKSKREWLPR